MESSGVAPRGPRIPWNFRKLGIFESSGDSGISRISGRGPDWRIFEDLWYFLCSEGSPGESRGTPEELRGRPEGVPGSSGELRKLQIL